MAVKTYKQVAIQMLAVAVSYVIILFLAGELHWGSSGIAWFSAGWTAFTIYEIWKVRRARAAQE